MLIGILAVRCKL